MTKVNSKKKRKPSINSKKKGSKGELEFANLCKEYGFKDARRSQQYAGINNDADVVGLPEMHIEVKRVERLNIDNAMDQCERDKKDEEMGMVAHRKNNKDWIISMKADDWFEIYKRYLTTLK